MSDDVTQNDVANYSPAQTVSSNADSANIQAQIQAAVQKALADLNVQAQPAAPVQQTPEEEARAAIENAGAGLGIDERLNELYKHLALIAQKVGL